MKYPSIFLLFFLPIAAFSQSEKPESAAASSAFVQLYNDEKFPEVFELFSDQMKEALPIDQTLNFLKSLTTQLGKIKTSEFKRYQNGTYASYKTTFEKGVFSIEVSVDGSGKVNGFFVKPYQDVEGPVLERNVTSLILPFKEKMFVFWGGDTEAQNYHVVSPAQKGAFDLLMMDENGSSHTGAGDKNEDYYVFGKELIAPCDGEVVLAVDGIKDNKPGEMNPLFVTGNTVVLKTTRGEFLVFAHFKQNSIVVKEGQMVKQGELLGLCGNSGNTSEAHLHFHIQNVEDMTKAIGAKCYFKEIYVNGEIKKDYSPVKGEVISNTK